MMAHTRILLPTLLFSIVVLLVTMGSVLAQPQPYQYYGGDGGEISGYVVGASNQPVDWAPVYASSAHHTYLAFSGMSGFYELRVPAGTYNMTVKVEGYDALVTNATILESSLPPENDHLNSITVTVTDGSSTVVNFYLQQTQTQVPEFQESVIVVMIALVTSTFVLRRLRQ